jgi:predicted nuclease of predicted toxin-antitoxin system
MRFLANENVPGDVVTALIEAGHDVLWVRTVAPGSTDAEVLAWAVREQRVLLTFDQDFGELAWRAGLPASCGIVLFRMPMPTPNSAGATIAATLSQRTDWAGHFSVIQPGRIRMRPLPRP